MIERIVQAAPVDDSVVEEEFEVKLRPHDFASYVGQDRIKRNLQLAITAAIQRGEPLDHVLLYGPPGLGKTTLAQIIRHEMGTQMVSTSGPALKRPGDLLGLLSNLKEGDVFFIDEIHRLPAEIEEYLYPA